MFSVSIICHSKIKELSDGNKNWKYIQTNYSSMGPTNFELYVMEIKLWVIKSENPNSHFFEIFKITDINLYFPQKKKKKLKRDKFIQIRATWEQMGNYEDIIATCCKSGLD